MKPEPIRLLEDARTEPELSAALREFAAEPVHFDIDEGLARLEEALPPSPPATPPLKTAAGAARAKWLGAATVGAGIAGAVAVVALLRSGDPPTPETPAAVQSPVLIEPPAVDLPPIETAEEPPAEHPEDAAPEAEESLIEGQAQGEEAAVIPEKRPARPRAPKPPPQSGESIAEEVRHLSELRRLAESDPRAAIRLADEGHRRFAGGALYQEREAVAISALAGAGRADEARRRGERFLATFPKSPFADRVRRAAQIEP